MTVKRLMLFEREGAREVSGNCPCGPKCCEWPPISFFRKGMVLFFSKGYRKFAVERHSRALELACYVTLCAGWWPQFVISKLMIISLLLQWWFLTEEDKKQ